jgi:hypothetical protein
MKKRNKVNGSGDFIEHSPVSFCLATRVKAATVDGALAVHSPLGLTYTPSDQLLKLQHVLGFSVLYFRLVEVLADERNHIRWTRNGGHTGVEDQFCDLRGRLNFGLENISLQRI